MKKILPTNLLLISLIAMLGLSVFFPIKQFLFLPASLLGLLPLAAGLVITVQGSNKFEQVGTNIKTFADPDVLVTDGLYRFSRNPMYLGFVLILLGVAMLFGKASPFIAVIAYLLICDRWYIKFEEGVHGSKIWRCIQGIQDTNPPLDVGINLKESAEFTERETNFNLGGYFG